jgi:uncharacterized damage-inducible protein DinB
MTWDVIYEELPSKGVVDLRDLKGKRMKLTDLLLAQLERETEGTRNAVKRVPEGRNDWKPHDKSMKLGYLAGLVATMPAWIEAAVIADELDFQKPHNWGAKEYGTSGELVDAFEQSLEKGRKALASTTDDHLMTIWTLRAGEHIILQQPRYVVIEDTFTHLAHHRGQLTVYLRLTGASVPAIYGPSADEGNF